MVAQAVLIFSVYLQNKVERNVRHMQYMAWPDHGVPDSPKMFLRFTQNVREARGDSTAPVIVHCSAGIGRTGVLVLMESALCLIEAGEPVYPLDIVQMMRKQRAMMIQNAVSASQTNSKCVMRLVFVCRVSTGLSVKASMRLTWKRLNRSRRRKVVQDESVIKRVASFLAQTA